MNGLSFDASHQMIWPAIHSVVDQRKPDESSQAQIHLGRLSFSFEFFFFFREEVFSWIAFGRSPTFASSGWFTRLFIRRCTPKKLLVVHHLSQARDGSLSFLGVFFLPNDFFFIGGSVLKWSPWSFTLLRKLRSVHWTSLSKVIPSDPLGRSLRSLRITWDVFLPPIPPDYSYRSIRVSARAYWMGQPSER